MSKKRNRERTVKNQYLDLFKNMINILWAFYMASNVLKLQALRKIFYEEYVPLQSPIMALV